jgi:hypothetical protein
VLAESPEFFCGAMADSEQLFAAGRDSELQIK